MRTHTTRIALSVASVMGVLALAACGSSSTSSDTTSAAASEAPATAAASEAASASASAEPVSGADVAAAEAMIAPYTGHPTAFPIDTPLAKKATGKRVAIIDCGTPICGLFVQLATPAFQTLGMEPTAIKSGLTADTVKEAFDTVIQDKYDGVFVPAIPAALWSRSLEQLNEANIPVVSTGVINLDETAVPVQQAGTVDATLAGQLLAAQVVANTGADSNVVFYYTPELDFTNLAKDTFVEEMGKLCPDCAVRTTKVPVATFGTKAPSLVIDDLQANPGTTTAVFGIGEQAAGLAAALETAGLDVETIVNSPDPANLDAIQKGDIDLGFGLDLPVLAWTLADSLARLSTGEQPAPGALTGLAPRQFLSAADLPGDVSHGWTAYPDFADRFMALWANAS